MSEYTKAGVDLEKAAWLNRRIKEILGKGVGLFAGKKAVDLSRFQNPAAVITVQHLGLEEFLDHPQASGHKLATDSQKRLTALGVEPLFFLDYHAGGVLDEEAAEACIRGMRQGCGDEMVLLGGETAEMPGVIKPDQYETVGFALGIAEAEAVHHHASPDTFVVPLELRGFRKPALVASVDGVGTKTKVALLAGKHYGIGQDLANHCGNDLSVCGGFPLFLIGYLGMDPSISSGVPLQLSAGLSTGCENFASHYVGMAQRTTASVYEEGQYDLVGLMVGVVEEDAFLDGTSVQVGDVILGLASNGLHTNGYSLVRRAVFEKKGWKVDQQFREVVPELAKELGIPEGITIGDELLRVHRPYGRAIRRLLTSCHPRAFAHITGEGVKNIPRVIPKNMLAEISMRSWSKPFIFSLIQEIASVPEEEMHIVFNMGIGVVVILPPHEEKTALKVLREVGETPYSIGRIQWREPKDPRVILIS